MDQTYGTLPTGQRQELSPAQPNPTAAPNILPPQPALGGVAQQEAMRRKMLMQQLLGGKSNIQPQPMGLMQGPPTLESILMQREMGGQ